MSRANIAIVEDDASVRKSAEGLLQAAGFGTASFASAEAFLKFERRSETDCIILDIFLPGMCGMEAITILKRELPNTKIIVMSGSGRARDNVIHETAKRLGADATFNKPFDATQLLAAIKSLLP
ncbi:MAG: response regulator [Rhodospirillaceae bacterium]|nr:response regulator [Rhodospirillaceae bacterium]